VSIIVINISAEIDYHYPKPGGRGGSGKTNRTGSRTNYYYYIWYIDYLTFRNHSPLCIISRCSQRRSPKNGGASATNRSRPILHKCLPLRAYSGLLPLDDDTSSSYGSSSSSRSLSGSLSSSSLLLPGDLLPLLQLPLLRRRRRPRRTRSRIIWLLRPMIVVLGLAVVNFWNWDVPHTTRRSNGVGGGSGTENSR